MSKIFRTLITILCIVSFGVFGFAAYKIFNTVFLHSSTPTVSTTNASVSNQTAIIPNTTEPQVIAAQQSTNSTAPVETSADGISNVSDGCSYTIDKKYHELYSNGSGKWIVSSFRVTNTGKTRLVPRPVFWSIVDSNGDPVIEDNGYEEPYYRFYTFELANPPILASGESAWYCLTALYEDDPEYSVGNPLIPTKDISLGGVLDDMEFPATVSGVELVDIVYFPVSNLRLIEENGRPVAYGTLGDPNMGTDIMPVYVYVNLFDQDGFLIGQLRWSQFRNKIGENREFKAELYFQGPQDENQYPTLPFSSIADYEVIAYQEQY